jgi:hypothetical protein
MKLAFWVLVGLGATSIAFWLIASGFVPKSPLVEALAIVFFTLPSIGAFWMLYAAIRYEKKPIGYIALAFIPYTFLWYYFERIRTGAVTRTRLGSS